jgi:diguanylate cyclase (GGDEF)-like protein/PAS domain S-box-containing protein
VVPLVVSRRVDGDPLIATMYVAADDGVLSQLRGPLAALGDQAALALERITLSKEIVQRDSERYFRTLIQHTADAILIVDGDRIRYASPSAATILGDPIIVGRSMLDFVAPSERRRAAQALMRVRDRAGDAGTAHWQILRPGGELADVAVDMRDLREEPTVGGLVFTVRDITPERRMQSQLRHLAFHDALTGLPNRTRFEELVRAAVSADQDEVAGVLFIDIDDFRVVNDTMGHEIGDQLLEETGHRLAQIMLPSDTAARLGGDEFGVLVRAAPDVAEVERVARGIVRALGEQVTLGGSLVSPSVSIGVATTVDASTSTELLRQADLALYVAKGVGKGRWRRYQSSLHSAMVHRLELRHELDRAIQSNEFAVQYQPIVALQSGRTEGFEALLRWRHPRRGLVSPVEFIDIAEESGLIVPIGAATLRQALSDATAWTDDPGVGPYVSVNISVRQFRSPGLIEQIHGELVRSGLAPRRLVLEITESLLLRDDEQVWQDLARLQELGIRVAIDDFGTGYSSLSYLRQAAVDVLKVDKAFIDAMATSIQQRALVETIVHLARTLGLAVVAEGIQRSEDRDLLVAMGCPYGQGYLYSAAMDQDDARHWMEVQREEVEREQAEREQGQRKRSPTRFTHRLSVGC